MNRRDLFAMICGSLAAWPTWAQMPAEKRYRIAVVTPVVGWRKWPIARVFLSELGRLGYVEGQDLGIEDFTTKGRVERIPEVAHQVVASKPDLTERWRETVCKHGADADRKNGPAARNFAADAHDCIMVRIQTVLPHTSLWRDAPQWRAPLGSSTDSRAASDAKLPKIPCRSSSSLRVLRRQGAANTSAAKAASRQAMLTVSVP